MTIARDDVKCCCVSSFGPNAECGACGGSGCITAEVPTPPDLIQAAREAAAWAYRDTGMLLYAAEAREGKRDGSVPVQAALRSLQTPHQGLEDGRRPEAAVSQPMTESAQELIAIREILLEGQGDDDGGQILPNFEEGMTVHAMVAACVHLLERRRDALDGYASGVGNPNPSPTTGGEAPGRDDGWRTYQNGDDPRPDVEWSGYLPDAAESGPAIAYADETGEPLFVVWWDDFGNGSSRITRWRDLPADLSASPRSSQKEEGV